MLSLLFIKANKPMSIPDAADQTFCSYGVFDDLISGMLYLWVFNHTFNTFSIKLQTMGKIFICKTKPAAKKY